MSPISQHDLDILADPGKVEVVNNSTGRLFAKIQLMGTPLPGEETATENNLNMSVRYLDLEGNLIDPACIGQGTDFMAEVTLHHPGIRADYEEMALTQVFPSGWEIRNIRMDNSAVLYMKDEPEYQDIRDDRVYSYFNLPKNQTRTYRVLLNAAYLGRFYLPSVVCEAMYDHEISANSAGQWVEVIEAGE